MATLAIVENFNVLKDSQPCFGASLETAVNALGLEGGEEAFHHGIIKHVACATHAGPEMMSGQQGLVGFEPVGHRPAHNLAREVNC